MNKQFMYVNGTIVISDENGMKPAIPYVDNIEDVLILENEIEFLEHCLRLDERALETKISDREYRNKDSLKISLVGSALAVGATFGLSQILGLSHENITNTIMGPMSEYLAFSIPMSVGCVGFVQMISLLGLSYRPSKKDIKGIEEKINFEKEMLAVFKDELTYLQENPTYDRRDTVEEMKSYEVHYKYSLDYLKEALKLRYSFGYNPDKFIKLYEDGQLPFVLTEEGFSDDVVMEFISFIEKRIKEQEKEVKSVKK